MQGPGGSRRAQCQTQAPSHLQVGPPGLCCRAGRSQLCKALVARAWHILEHMHSMCQPETKSLTCAPACAQRPLHAAGTVRRCWCRAQAQRPSVSTEAAHALLGIPPGSTKAEIRAAYIEQMKELHPDVNPLQDTTGPAADLNAAYSYLLEVRSCSICKVCLQPAAMAAHSCLENGHHAWSFHFQTPGSVPLHPGRAGLAAGHDPQQAQQDSWQWSI